MSIYANSFERKVHFLSQMSLWAHPTNVFSVALHCIALVHMLSKVKHQSIFLHINSCHMTSLFLLFASCAVVLITFFVPYLRRKECSTCIHRNRIIAHKYRNTLSKINCIEKNRFNSFYYYCPHILLIYLILSEFLYLNYIKISEYICF